MYRSSSKTKFKLVFLKIKWGVNVEITEIASIMFKYGSNIGKLAFCLPMKLRYSSKITEK